MLITEVQGNLNTIGYLLSGTLIGLAIIAVVAIFLGWRARRR